MKNLLSFTGLFSCALVMVGCQGGVETCEFRDNFCSERIAEINNGEVTKFATWVAQTGTPSGCQDEMLEISGARVHNEFAQNACKVDNGACVIDTASSAAPNQTSGKFRPFSGAQIDLKAICTAAGVVGCKKITLKTSMMDFRTEDEAKANTGSFCHVVKR